MRLDPVETDREKVFERALDGAPVGRLPGGLVPARQILDGSVLRLEPLNPAVHAAELYRASHDSAEALAIWEYLPFGPWSSEDAYRDWLRVCAASFDFIWYVFRLKADGEIRGEIRGEACGMAGYLDVQPAQGVIEIGGIWFAPDMQRTRAATEALFLMLSYAMDDLGNRRMQWRCNALNQRSRNAAVRLGFKFEGIFYNHMIYKGLNRDTAWYSILDSDWPAVRQAIAAWLSDANFDTDGLAQSALSEAMRNRAVAARGAL